MNCHDALLLLEFARPGATELEAVDIAALETHLAECPACSAFARSERQCSDRMAQAFAVVPAKIGGPRKLKKHLSRQRLRWQIKHTALASAVTGFAAVTWWAMPGPYFDPTAYLNVSTEQVANRAGAIAWLESQNRKFQFPPQFRVTLLNAFERQRFYGTTAPVLTFISGNSIARVAVVTDRQFRNLGDFTDERVAENSLGSIHIIRDPNVPGVVYLVEVINGSIENFLEKPSVAT